VASASQSNHGVVDIVFHLYNVSASQRNLSYTQRAHSIVTWSYCNPPSVGGGNSSSNIGGHKYNLRSSAAIVKAREPAKSGRWESGITRPSKSARRAFECLKFIKVDVVINGSCVDGDIGYLYVCHGC
jgi:hypothetical protein